MGGASGNRTQNNPVMRCILKFGLEVFSTFKDCLAWRQLPSKSLSSVTSTGFPILGQAIGVDTQNLRQRKRRKRSRILLN